MKRILTLAAGLFVTLVLHGCATYKPVPEGYTGPVATVADSGKPGDGMKSEIFAMVEVDENRIENSFGASRREMGSWRTVLTTRFISRPVQAKPMKVKLVGAHKHVDNMHAIVGQIAGKSFSVMGTVDFNPVAGGNYLVKGVLQKGGSSVWIEDRATGLPVTEKIVEK